MLERNEWRMMRTVVLQIGLILIVLSAIGCSAGRPAESLQAVHAALPRIEAERLATRAARVERTPAARAFAARINEGQREVDANEGLEPRSTYALDDVGAEGATAEVSVAPGAASPRALLPDFGATVKRDVKALPADLWADTKKVYGSPTNLLILGLSYGGALAVQETGPDDTIERSYRTHKTFDDEWRNIFSISGSPATHFALAGVLYLAGQQTQHEKTYETSRKLTSALVITGLSTLLGKAATWDDNPDGDLGAFPSGHASSTFALAAVMHEQYGPLAGVPLYALGGLVSIQRLEDGEHYLSDVVFGGVLGLVIGHTIAADKPLELFGGQIIPYADPHTQSTGVAWWKPIQ